MLYSVVGGDCLDWLKSLPSDSVDLVLGSPPYEKARTYSINFKLKGQAWVDWMVQVFIESLRVSTGAVVMVVEGQTSGFRWSAVPALLMADLHRLGVNLRKPPAYCRVGIPGSGGPDWFRNDYEFCVVATRRGKLKWSNPTALGHPPKWAPGGAMAHRLSDGSRVNQWGAKPTSTKSRDVHGDMKGGERPSHKFTNKRKSKAEKLALGAKSHTKNGPEGMNDQTYLPPVLANPGNTPQATYTAAEVAELLKAAEESNVRRLKVGGGLMGSPLAHENEAPFPLKLADFFVRSLSPPGGIVCDPFSGSGTTGHAAIEAGRRYWGCDIRQSQVKLSLTRLASVTPGLYEGA